MQSLIIQRKRTAIICLKFRGFIVLLLTYLDTENTFDRVLTHNQYYFHYRSNKNHDARGAFR